MESITNTYWLENQRLDNWRTEGKTKYDYYKKNISSNKMIANDILLYL